MEIDEQRFFESAKMADYEIFSRFKKRYRRDVVFKKSADLLRSITLNTVYS